ncbi:MAPEG family protein [Luteimonas sp. SJ-92]|uniref:MAPEG family protein n=1 Tax=Luteimonas salinisoli TaxID=2752307 RepID=A0A853JE44_9GAMM|nr:MAPEG family protein [Luteimonas salinisoli]NZA27024.1 MAPEG family protein [Luteimonas salinisoli]
MEIQPILLPGLAMVALTFVVMTVMYRRRVAQMLRERIHPQAVATSTQAAARLTDCTAADNFRNLFELPVLFYFALASAALTGQATVAVQALAWAFVALRIVHSAIHCGYNKVMHRFRAYLLGALVLLLLWLRLAWGLLAA